ncbi:HU family DNA-binding protein [Histidinibacterium lentulum]|uniref:HU family DNA-binding protein n=1 Tax=Histidinibacterium lentulum TaxID=2480588 RepID=A0A3N2RA04_9RHOB|nr:HU family DNA-binding protein [Histidinibacterium lentulum]ROU04258.1 HU family DNA-binding protein [Histidinibacterium lentulum]
MARRGSNGATTDMNGEGPEGMGLDWLTEDGLEPPAASASASTTAKAVTVAGPELKKKELIDRIVARSGLKRREVKPAVEAMLQELAAAVQAGEELNLPPFGKLKITRSKDLANARVFHCRLRQAEGGTAAAEPLAEADEEG